MASWWSAMPASSSTWWGIAGWVMISAAATAAVMIALHDEQQSHQKSSSQQSNRRRPTHTAPPSDSPPRLKTILLGEAGTGKTSLNHRFTHDRFPDPHTSTIGAAFSQKEIVLTYEELESAREALAAAAPPTSAAAAVHTNTSRTAVAAAATTTSSTTSATPTTTAATPTTPAPPTTESKEAVNSLEARGLGHIRLLTPAPITALNKFRLQLWDTAGSERYRAIAPMYYRGASIVFLVIDNTARSLERAHDWWNDMVNNLHGADVTVVVAHNKSDLPASEYEISEADVRAFVATMGAQILYARVSAKSGVGVEEMFRAAVARHSLR